MWCNEKQWFKYLGLVVSNFQPFSQSERLAGMRAHGVDPYNVALGLRSMNRQGE